MATVHGSVSVPFPSREMRSVSCESLESVMLIQNLRLRSHIKGADHNLCSGMSETRWRRGRTQTLLDRLLLAYLGNADSDVSMTMEQHRFTAFHVWIWENQKQGVWP